MPVSPPNLAADVLPEMLPGLFRWKAASGGFASWERGGAVVAPDGSLQAGSGGEAISPVVPTPDGLREAIPSWAADTPTGTWIEVLLRVRTGVDWTHWYHLGVWAAETETVERHSVAGQSDATASVSTDTLVAQSPETVEAIQVKVRLCTNEAGRAPVVRSVSLSVAVPEMPAPRAGDSARWGRHLPVPAYSQMVYPDGGSVWCSPTSVSMVMAYWEGDDGPPEPRVRAAVAGVYDRVYGGHGNWSFNAAYAARHGYEAYVTRLPDLAEAERWIAAGIPLVLSYGWQPGELTHAPVPRSNGHLGVLVGFDAAGDPLVNDPAARDPAEVTRAYPRAELERVWQNRSGGTVYVIYPAPGR